MIFTARGPGSLGIQASDFDTDFQLRVGWRDFGEEKIVSIHFRVETHLDKWFDKVDYLHRAARQRPPAIG